MSIPVTPRGEDTTVPRVRIPQRYSLSLIVPRTSFWVLHVHTQGHRKVPLMLATQQYV